MTSLLIWLGLAALFVLSILCLALGGKQEVHHEEDRPGYWTTLLWCEGCNDKHMRQWFRWTDDGLLRCMVCCSTNTTRRNR